MKRLGLQSAGEEELRHSESKSSGSDAAPDQPEQYLAELRKVNEESQRRIADLRRECDRLQLENGRLARMVQTRFNEVAELTKMLLERGNLENRVASFAGEIARLDRRMQILTPPTRCSAGKEEGPAIRHLKVFLVPEQPVVLQVPADGSREVFVEMTLFGDVRRRVKAARLTAEAIDSGGKVLAGAQWRQSGTSASRIRGIARRLWLRSRKNQPHSDHRVLAASPEGESFAEHVMLPASARYLRLSCARLVNGHELRLVCGNAVLFDRPVVPNEEMNVLFDVRAERSLKRAAMLIPQYFDAAGKPVPPPYGGFRSDEGLAAYAPFAAEVKARRTSLHITAPTSAVRLRLQVRPDEARGQLDITEVPLDPVFSFTRSPSKGIIKVSLTLLAPFDDPQAAVLLPTCYGAAGKRIEETFEEFESSEQFRAFRYLPASPVGTTTTLKLAVPPGVRKCKLDVVPWNVSLGLRVESDGAAKEAAQINGALLPEEGVGLECEVDSSAFLSFKLRVTGARDLNDAGTCAITFFNSAGERIPLPYAGLQEHGEAGGVLSFGASSRPQGRVEIVRVPCPAGAARAGLRFVPRAAEDALRIRIEPLGNQQCLVKRGS